MAGIEQGMAALVLNGHICVLSLHGYVTVHEMHWLLGKTHGPFTPNFREHPRIGLSFFFHNVSVQVILLACPPEPSNCSCHDMPPLPGASGVCCQIKGPSPCTLDLSSFSPYSWPLSPFFVALMAHLLLYPFPGPHSSPLPQ